MTDEAFGLDEQQQTPAGVINVSELKRRIDNLENRYLAKAAASEAYADAIDAAATAINCTNETLRRFIAARCDDKVVRVKKLAETVLDLFEAVN